LDLAEREFVDLAFAWAGFFAELVVLFAFFCFIPFPIGKHPFEEEVNRGRFHGPRNGTRPPPRFLCAFLFR
jgi:hypothetical protein